MKNLDSRALPASATLDARDALRNLVPRLDRAIAATDTALLSEILGARHPVDDSLKSAPKHPAPVARRSRAGAPFQGPRLTPAWA